MDDYEKLALQHDFPLDKHRYFSMMDPARTGPVVDDGDTVTTKGVACPCCFDDVVDVVVAVGGTSAAAAVLDT